MSANRASSHPSLRFAALNCITQTANGRHIQSALASSREVNALSSADRQLCSDLVYGYFRNMARLDFILAKFLANQRKVPESVAIILKLGFYSLLYQDKIPAYAIVNESVEAAKKLFKGGFTRLANAVLRNAIRQNANLRDFDWYKKDSDNDLWQAYSIYYSMPLNIMNLWREAYSAETALNLVKKSGQRPYSAIRLNPGHELYAVLSGELALLAENTPEQVIRIDPHGFAFAPAFLPQKLASRDIRELSRANALFFQGAASMLVMAKLGLYDWRLPVWDCCAGFGGKSLALLENGVNVALMTDVNMARSRDSARLCQSRGFAPAIINGDLKTSFIKNWPGHILLDAPCSGLGTLARRPDLKYNRYTGRMRGPEFTIAQRQLLREMFARLSAGSQLAYITCTVNPAENENLVAEFVASNKNAELMKCWQTPLDHPWLEGMYGAVLRKISQ